jgi:hypothetical protein
MLMSTVLLTFSSCCSGSLGGGVCLYQYTKIIQLLVLYESPWYSTVMFVHCTGYLYQVAVINFCQKLLYRR